MISLRHFFTIILLPTYVFTNVNAETLPSQLNLERGWDSADGSDYFVDADIDLSGPRLFIGYGESDSQLGSTVLNTTTTQVELSSNPFNDTAMAIGYSEWGQDGEIDIKTYRLDFIFNTDNWGFRLAPQTREIELYTLAAMRPKINLDSDGINVGINYYAAEPFYIGAVYSAHNYSRNLSTLSTDPRLALIFSPATMEYAFGFEKERIAGNMGLAFSWGSAGIDGSRSVSEIDNSISTSIAVSIRYKLNKHWSIKARGGQSDNSFSTAKISFGSVSVGYQF